jgi:uncharacterized protein (TIRG00374 family)
VRGRLFLLFRLVVAGVITAYVIRAADPSTVAAALRGVSGPWLLGASLLVLIDRSFMAYRWLALIDPADRPPFLRVLRIFFESSFVGSFLPGSVGGDAARAWSLSRDGVSGSRSLASVLMDRLLGVIAIVASAMIGVAIVPAARQNAGVLWAVAIGAVGCAVAVAVVFSHALDRFARAVLASTLLGPLGTTGAALSRLLDALQQYRLRSGPLVSVLGASAAVQVLRVAQAWMLGRGLGLTVPFDVYLAYIPVILLVMLLPITISGLGTGNAAFVWLFGQVGVSSADAFALSVLFLALGLLGNLPGAVLYVAAPRRAPA